VRDWVTVAAGVRGFNGFAVGCTVFWDPLAAWRARKTTREATVAEISRRYQELVAVYETARHGA
jgi:myo-inositol catabolism protein IolC